jgi:hypothetical protein
VAAAAAVGAGTAGSWEAFSDGDPTEGKALAFPSLSFLFNQIDTRTKRMKALPLFCAVTIALMLSPGRASALPALKASVAASGVTNVYHRVRAHRGGGLFSNWCAYNCYRVSPCARGRCLGRYQYSRYAYDQDIPFCYRYDRDGSAIDNVLATIHLHAGAPYLRNFERRW